MRVARETGLIRVEAGEGISIANVMGLNDAATITLVNGNVKQVYLQNILAKKIEAGGVDVIAVNCPPISDPSDRSVING